MPDPLVEVRPGPIQLSDPELSDVTLFVEKQDFLANKMILADRCLYFKKMFDAQPDEAYQDRFEIKDVPIDAFRRFLEFLYNEKVSDEPVFLSYPKDYNNNTTRHVIGEQIGEYCKNFWKYTTELLKVAKQFGSTYLTKEYLESAISSDSCDMANCQICSNRWIFAMKHELEVEQDNMVFSKECLDCWIDFLEAGSLDGVVEFNNQDLVAIYRKFNPDQ